ncbi:hypothetical protein GLOIN_2v1880406 [Rhizophagus irregularis DAOM 181602=DAOM 197198]|nr:hypothetical protein GLOIN_2v1880406 [Rhizophagus irregularis DAOM 181602=DAOM 197198]
MYTPHAVSVIPELVGHILEHIPTHKKAEEAYDRAVEKKEKANDVLANHWRRRVPSVNLNGRRYQKACKELTDTRKKLTIVKGALERTKNDCQTSTQAQVIPKFGEQKKAFSIDELKRLINAAKNMRDLNQAKGYLCSYFIPCSNPHGVFMWRSEIKNLEHIPDKNINKLIR